MIPILLIAAPIYFEERTQTVVARGGEPRVYLGEMTTPLLGDVTRDGVVARFHPRFPLLPDRDYRVVAGALSYSFHTRAVAATQPRVTAVYPSAEVLPANLLKFYVHFSGPMPPRGTAERIRLVDENGVNVADAFLQTEDELWDRERCRLTLFLDPGRIKRGVGLRESIGLALKPGGRYRLMLDRDVLKEFRVRDEDRVSPDVSRWRIDASDALTVTSDEPLDRALFTRLLRVEDTSGRVVDGSVTVDRGETQWRFTPDRPWQTGEYRLRIAAELEDLAGNRPTRLFDELTSPDGHRLAAHDLVVPFRIPGI